MQSPLTLTAEQSKALLSFHASSQMGKTVYLNPSDPGHKNVIDVMHSVAGHTSDNYPHLHANMSSAKTNATTAVKGEALDRVQLVDAGKTASGKATARVWSRSSGKTLINCGNLMVFDGDTGELLAQGANSTVKRGFLECPVQGENALPAGKKLSILYTGNVTDEDGSSRMFSYADTAMVANEAIQCTVSQPVIQHSQNTAIWIAVGRDGGHPPPSNTDYIYVWASGQNPNNPYLIVPFVGNVALSGTIDLSSLTISDISTSIYVNNGQGGTVEITRYSSDSKMIAGFSVGSAPNILQWSWPFTPNQNYSNTTSIVYNQSTLGDDLDNYFVFAFNSIPFTDGSASPAFYVCSVGLPGEPSLNCTQIPNIHYWWHCLVKGTMVTLEDGTQKPIEEINEHCRVRSNDGQSYAVIATIQGTHASTPAGKEIYRLTTANGKTIVTTASHGVFIANNQCRLVSDLSAGDPIVTDEGMSTVETLEPISGDDMFYGLALGNPSEQAAKSFPTNNVGYYSNGVFSADQMTTHRVLRETHHDLDFRLPRIKAELRTDYASAVNQKRS